jgi:predicted extracellular nuclease
MGDLNVHEKKDPVYTLVRAGYVDVCPAFVGCR